MDQKQTSLVERVGKRVIAAALKRNPGMSVEAISLDETSVIALEEIEKLIHETCSGLNPTQRRMIERVSAKGGA